MYKIIFLILIIITTISCDTDEVKDDKGETVNIYDISTVTGMYLRKSKNDEFFKLGNPYSKTESPILIFPSLTSKIIEFEVDHLYAQSSSKISLSDVWFVKCNPIKVDNSKELNKIDYSESEINLKSKYHFEPKIEHLNESFIIDGRNFEPGYYKIFIKSNETIVWDIIYIQESDFSFEKFIEYWK